MLAATLGASLQGNMLAGKGVLTADEETIRAVEGIIKAGKGVLTVGEGTIGAGQDF